MSSPAIGRFAPSPSGPLHYGSLLAAVASYLSVRSKNGNWLVRIEDLDPPRVIPEADAAILHALELHGLHWDGPVIYQSQRNQQYESALSQLKAADLLYPCSCSRKDIALRGETIYQGHCINHYQAEKGQTVLRIKTARQKTSWPDLVQGQQSFNLDNTCGDFVLQRSDKLFAYHLAVVVDDADQHVSEIIRGADLLSSTPAQLFVQKALGYKIPQYGHIPVALNKQGKKLSKQTGASAVSLTTPEINIQNTLFDLGQDPPADLISSNVNDMLKWGIENWNPSKIPTGATL